MTQGRDAAIGHGDTVTLDLSGPEAHRIGATIATAVAAAVGEAALDVSVRRKGCSEAIRQMASSSFSVVPNLDECVALVFRGAAGTALAAPVVAAIGAALAAADGQLRTVRMKVVAR